MTQWSIRLKPKTISDVGNAVGEDPLVGGCHNVTTVTGSFHTLQYVSSLRIRERPEKSGWKLVQGESTGTMAQSMASVVTGRDL